MGSTTTMPTLVGRLSGAARALFGIGRKGDHLAADTTDSIVPTASPVAGVGSLSGPADDKPVKTPSTASTSAPRSTTSSTAPSVASSRKSSCADTTASTRQNKRPNTSVPPSSTVQDHNLRLLAEETELLLLVGNTSEPLDKNRSKWTLQVKPLSKNALQKQRTLGKILRVKFHLHPTFQPPTRIVTRRDDQDLKIASDGWGEFEVGVEIFFSATLGLPPLEVRHTLDFGSGKKGTWQEVRVDLPERTEGGGTEEDVPLGSGSFAADVGLEARRGVASDGGCAVVER